MKAIDLLIAARDRFLANPHNLYTGALAFNRPTADDGKCLCYIGGVLNEAGAFPKVFTGKYEDTIPVYCRVMQNADSGTTEFAALRELAVAVTSWQVATKPFREKTLADTRPAKKSLGEFDIRAAITAIAYLQSAASILFNQNVISVNDQSYKDEGTRRDNVIKMFNLAIHNAKHRHINGKLQKKASTFQGVSQ